MIRKFRPSGLGVVLAIAQLSGCTSFVSSLPPFAQSGPNPVAASDQAHGDAPQASPSLPPKTAAAACIATAKQLQAHGDVNEAILLYERARQLNPEERQVSRFLAVLYDQQGNDVRALAEYRKALEVSPRDADVLNDLGYFFYHRQHWPEAEAHFRQAIAAAPAHERAWVNLGLVLGEEGRYQESFEAFEKPLGAAAAHSNVGVILAAHHQEAAAKAAFQRALAQQPNLQQPRAFLTYLEQPQPVQTAQTSAKSN